MPLSSQEIRYLGQIFIGLERSSTRHHAYNGLAAIRDAAICQSVMSHAARIFFDMEPLTPSARSLRGSVSKCIDYQIPEGFKT